tara:strand:- start:3359 stop:4252 length:894 start_codon:yes stop_codon:yes gene_type:complete
MEIYGKVENIKKKLTNKIISGYLSGKNYQDENFPVSSFLIKKNIKKHVRNFYFYARTADDIADNKKLSSNAKMQILEELNYILSGKIKSDVSITNNLINSLNELNISTKNPQDLLKAFKSDTHKKRYEDWSQLINYCKYSANPVGRFVIQVNYIIEKKKSDDIDKIYKASDNLCTSLQIINHLQDCKKDFLELDRIYIPKSMFKKFNSKPSEIKEDKSSENFKLLKIQIINKVEELLEQSKAGLKLIQLTRLRKETLIIFHIARKLCYLLKNNDPLEKNVKLSRIDLIFCFLKGIIS